MNIYCEKIKRSLYQLCFLKKGKVIIELTTSGRRSQDPEVYLIITTLKKQPITVVRVLTKEKDSPLVELSTQAFDLPQTMKYQETISLSSPYIAHNIEKLEKLCVEDATGKRWDVDRKSFEQSKKILRNFIGKRFLYPSMGDVVDEDKIT